MKNNRSLYFLTLYSNLLKTLIVSIFGVISIPIILKYFGTEKYGVWNVINSFMIYLSMTNLGLNAAASILMNKNSSNFVKIKIFKRSLKIIIIAIPIIFLILFIINNIYSNWINFINPPNNLIAESKTATLVMMCFILINLPFSLVSSALVGFQKNYVENIFCIIGATLSFIGVLITIRLAGSLVFLAGILGITNLIINISKMIYLKMLIFNKLKKEQTSVTNEESEYKVILITGIRCLLGSIASMVVLNTDNIVISKMIGIEAVSSYSVTFKLFTLIFTMIYIFNSSIIPLIGKEIENANFIKETYQNTYYGINLLGGLFWIGAVATLKIVVYYWTGKQGYAGAGAVFFLGAYSYIFAIVNLNYIMINSFNYIKGIATITWLEGATNLLISIILSKKYGLTGIAIGTFLGTFIFPFFMFPIILKKKSKGVIIQDSLFTLKHFLLVILPCLIIATSINQYLNNEILALSSTAILCGFYIFFSYVFLPKEYKKKIRIKKLKKWRKHV